MAITTSELAVLVVEDITDTDVNATLEGLIQYATKIYNAHLGSSALSADLADLITLNLAAHYYILSEDRGGLVEDKVSIETSQKYAGINGSGFNATRFGKEACMLDSTGVLSNISKKHIPRAVAYNV